MTDNFNLPSQIAYNSIQEATESVSSNEGNDEKDNKTEKKPVKKEPSQSKATSKEIPFAKEEGWEVGKAFLNRKHPKINSKRNTAGLEMFSMLVNEVQQVINPANLKKADPKKNNNINVGDFVTVFSKGVKPSELPTRLRLFDFLMVEKVKFNSSNSDNELELRVRPINDVASNHPIFMSDQSKPSHMFQSKTVADLYVCSSEDFRSAYKSFVLYNKNTHAYDYEKGTNLSWDELLQILFDCNFSHPTVWLKKF